MKHPAVQANSTRTSTSATLPMALGQILIPASLVTTWHLEWVSLWTLAAFIYGHSRAALAAVALVRKEGWTLTCKEHCIMWLHTYSRFMYQVWEVHLTSDIFQSRNNMLIIPTHWIVTQFLADNASPPTYLEE